MKQREPNIQTDDTATTVARAAGGDACAQRALYELYYGRAFRLAYLILRDSCDAEETVQDTFVYLFRNLGRYDAERASFWTWLRLTLVCRCRNKRRRRELPSVSLEDLVASGKGLIDRKHGLDPAAVLEARGAQQAIWELLQRVSPAARDALVLRYYEGLPYAEIGEILGCTAEAARSRVAHGKVQLRRLLTQGERESVRGQHLARPVEVE